VDRTRWAVCSHDASFGVALTATTMIRPIDVGVCDTWPAPLWSTSTLSPATAGIAMTAAVPKSLGEWLLFGSEQAAPHELPPWTRTDTMTQPIVDARSRGHS